VRNVRYKVGPYTLKHELVSKINTLYREWVLSSQDCSFLLRSPEEMAAEAFLISAVIRRPRPQGNSPRQPRRTCDTACRDDFLSFLIPIAPLTFSN